MKFRTSRLFAGALVTVAVLLGGVASWANPKPLVEGIVTGVVKADAGCASDSTRRNPQVWLSIGQILLYQVEVPVNGSYEFHVVPGKYDLAATGPNGCVAQAELTVGQDKTANTDLRLVAARKPASAK